jgi:acyl dehydratase
MTIEYPKTLAEWEGFYVEAVADMVVERGFIEQFLDAVRDGNPIYWNDEVAKEITGGIVAPPPMCLTFSATPRWSPRRPDQVWDVHGVEAPGTPCPIRMPLEAHFALKEFTGLREGIVGGIESEYYEPLRPGDRLTVRGSVQDIGEERTNKLGTGRNWIAKAEFKNQKGQLVSIERYKFFCYNRKG